MYKAGAEAVIPAVVLADARLRRWVRETWLIPSPAFSAEAGSDVHLKLENLQHTGSFKLRGAMNKCLELSQAGQDVAVVTASSGNHGAAVAYATHKLGGKAHVFVPRGASTTKVGKIRAAGASVECFGDDSAETEQHARCYALANGMPYIPPYNDSAVIAGQGTIAAELLRQSERIDNIFVSVGGGGLISGVAAYIKALSPHTKVIGCSPLNSCVMARSIEAGHILDLPSLDTLSDGTAGGIEPGSMTFDLCRSYVDHWIEVSEEEIAGALRLFFEAHSMLAEGAAGVSLAALRKAGPEWRRGRSVVVICGANIANSDLRQIV